MAKRLSNSIRGRHNIKQKSSKKRIKVGETVMVKGEYQRRGTRKIGRIEELVVEKDGVFRGVLTKTAKEFLEQPAQLQHPLELHCGNITDDSNETEMWMTKEGNTSGEFYLEASTFQPKRTAAAIALRKPNDITEDMVI